uniref:Protein EMBRYONIC FLOWER 1 n=1 Tax=Cajanus cajan TaxID=3821 RepID=A0A151TDQ7_CAJCA|nr:hypothetical protein KK1_011403 [Cajanus cajan]
MGSYIHIDSISIDLADSIGKRDAGKCEHFSIRGYVSEIRKKDWKICWPFPVHESDKQSSLLPLDVPKYSCQRCHKSPQETAAKDIQKDDQTDFGCYSTGCRSGSNAAPKSDVLQDAMLDNLERREIDLNTTLSCVNDYLPTSNEKKAGVVPSRIIDLEIGLEDNLNHLVASVPSPKIYPDLAPEVHTTKRGCESNEVSYPDHASNLKCMEKSSAEMCNGGTPADNQCQKDFIKACTVLGKGTTVMEVGNTYDQTIGPPLESVACNHAVPAGSMDNTTENDSQDHHSEKSTGLSRRRPRKVRLMADLLSDNGESKTEQSSIQESVSHGTSNASAAPQAHPTLPGNFDIQGGLTLTSTGPSRKRKFPLDEVRRTASMCFQGAENEVQNSEGDAKKTDTVLDTRSHSKDVPAGSGLQDATKGHWSKSETDRSHIMMGKKKNKKIHVDNCSIPVQPKGQQRENEDTTDTTDKAYASKTYSSRLTPRAFEGKGMDNFPHHTLRIENEFNLSKGKGKMLQTEAEMDSLLWQKNNTVLQDSCAYSGEKARSSMPITNPIPSVQGVLNGKGPEKGLHLSINNLLVEAHVYNNKKCIHQIENHLPFKMPFQDGTSKVPQLNWKDSDTNVFGGQNIPSKHPTNALSGKGVHCEFLIRRIGIPLGINTGFISMIKKCRMNGEYSFPCKHSGMEPHQNLRGSLDLYSNETIPAMHLLSLMDAGMQSSRTSYDVGVSAQMLKRPSYPGDCNTKLEIGTSKPPGTMKRISSDYYSRNFLSDKPHGCFVGSPTFGASSSTPHDKKVIATGFNGQNPTKTGKKEKIKSSNSTLQNSVSKQISWPHIETETSLQRRLQASVPYKIISGNSCMVNRNPADLTIPETGNIYMIRGEDLKFEKSIPKNRPRVPISFGYKQQRNFKGTKMKEHSKH